MNKTLSEIEFETRTIGPLVLTTPFLRRLGLRETINRLCPVAEQADFDYGLVAELVVQCRLTDPRALYDRPGWGCVPPSTQGALNKVSRLMMLMVVGASRDIMPKAAF